MKAGFILFPGLEELDLVGPWEVFAMWEKLGGPERLLIGETVDPVLCAKGMAITPHTTFNKCPPLDYLIVPGGLGTRTEVDNAALISFLTSRARTANAVLSVCTGAFLLQKAGLLNGRRATTHWASIERLRATGNVTVVSERMVVDGPIWTAAGVSAGIDLALAFVASVAGEETAGKVQLGAEYYPAQRIYGTAHQLPEAPGYLKAGR